MDLSTGSKVGRVYVRAAVADDDSAILDIYNRLHSDFPPVTVHEYREWIASRRETERIERWAADEDGYVSASLDLMEWDVAHPGVWRAFLQVAEDRRGRGLGSKLYEHLTRRLADLKATRVYSDVREDSPESRRFAERRGFIPTGHMARSSRLDLRRADLFDPETVGSSSVLQGIEIRALSEIHGWDGDFLRAVHHLYESTMADVPCPEPHQPRDFETWRRNMFDFPGNSPETFWIAVKTLQAGECAPVGIARLRVHQGDTSIAFNAYTAVDRDHRGRGIARALKSRTIRWAREHGIEYMYTDNDEGNMPILSVNRSLGYEALPGMIELVKNF